MKSFKIGLRVWIAITSIFSFLGGWALFSHSGKPAPLFPSASSAQSAPAVQSSGAALPTLAPIPSLDSLIQGSQSATNSSALQPLPSVQQSAPQSLFPRMITRGS